jgi:hypothetical protein
MFLCQILDNYFILLGAKLSECANQKQIVLNVSQNSFNFLSRYEIHPQTPSRLPEKSVEYDSHQYR